VHSVDADQQDTFDVIAGIVVPVFGNGGDY
jgi:hypothetical protein